MRRSPTGHVDPNNLFVTGGSGGGVLTAWIVGKTDRFRAAATQKPVIDWASFALTSDGAAYYSPYWFAKKPWEDPMGYWQRSPLSLVGNVKTPTLVVVGSEDYRTPDSEAEQYYTALQLRGVPDRASSRSRARATAASPRGRARRRPRRARSSPGSTATAPTSAAAAVASNEGASPHRRALTIARSQPFGAAGRHGRGRSLAIGERRMKTFRWLAATAIALAAVPHRRRNRRHVQPAAAVATSTSSSRPTRSKAAARRRAPRPRRSITSPTSSGPPGVQPGGDMVERQAQLVPERAAAQVRDRRHAADQPQRQRPVAAADARATRSRCARR